MRSPVLFDCLHRFWHGLVPCRWLFSCARAIPHGQFGCGFSGFGAGTAPLQQDFWQLWATCQQRLDMYLKSDYISSGFQFHFPALLLNALESICSHAAKAPSSHQSSVRFGFNLRKHICSWNNCCRCQAHFGNWRKWFIGSFRGLLLPIKQAICLTVHTVLRLPCQNPFGRYLWPA